MTKTYTRDEVEYIEDATNKGERICHLYPNDCYFAHLSIYHFAEPLCQNKRVLDAGCGTGYGSNYLAEHGAISVLGLDYSDDAVRFCRKHFSRANVEFRQMDITNIRGLQDKAFDAIFTSNALEHVPVVQGFFRDARRLLKDDGVLIVAVPPITDEKTRADDLNNRFHLNSWSPKQWKHVIGKYFGSVDVYRHICSRTDIPIDFLNHPDKCVITEKDFTFPPCTTEEMGTLGTLTAVFVARKPKAADEIPPAGSPVEFVDESFTRDLPKTPVVERLRTWLSRRIIRPVKRLVRR